MIFTSYRERARALAGALVAAALVAWPDESAAQANARIIVTSFSPPAPGPIFDNDPTRASVSAARGGIFESGGSWAWQASSTASLARGSVSSALGIQTAGAGFGYVNASGSIADQLTFTGSGDVEFTLAVQGSFRTLAETGFHAIGYLAFGNSTAGGVLNYTGNSPRFPNVSLSQTSGEARLISNHPANAIAWFTARQTVAPNSPLFIDASLYLDAFVGETDVASANFLHTAQLWVSMPAGMTFTSASGVFLTEAVPVSPVPEPETWALLLAGMGMLSMVARRRRSAG